MKIWQKILLGILLVLSICLRFINLGYSDYIGDEHKAFPIPLHDQSMFEFFMDQRKGPMQFLVAAVPYFFTHNWNNELAERIPFATISVVAGIVLFLFVQKVFEDTNIALVALFLYITNGFIAGFGRIAQYQNLNLLFSFLSLYFYASFLKQDRHLIRDSVLGTVFFSLSLLSHWDVVFILPVVLVFLAKFMFRKELDFAYKRLVILYSLLVGCIILLPFLFPYVSNQFSNADNARYFSRRVEVGYSNDSRYLELFKLYNPFVMFEVLVVFGLLGLLKIKKTWFLLLWFVFGYLMFEFFVRKPGTHIYNFILPCIILAACGVMWVMYFLPRYLKYLFGILILGIFIFLGFQTYQVFVDHKVEYPWEQLVFFEYGEQVVTDSSPKGNSREKVMPKQVITPVYTLEQKLPLFGFPHSRGWNEINEFVNTQNSLNNEQFKFISNEVKTISEWYMDTGYGINGGFYIVGINRPLSFVSDWQMAQFGRGEVVYTYKNTKGETVVKVYRITP